MDASLLSDLLFSQENSLLPRPGAFWLSMHLGWAVVLGSGTLLIGARLAPAFRLSLGLLVMLWSLWPGPASPAHWLGLAFQSPSLMTVVLCLVWVLQGARRQRRTEGLTDFGSGAPAILPLLGIALGWLLLLDTMALLPFTIYPSGFGGGAVAVALAVAALLWLVLGSGASVLPLAVLALFVLSRLPTGNVWDALLDPWLWLVLQIGWLVSAVRRRWTAGRLSPATRA
ncbi:MAG: hypothetical protein ACOYNZ_00580 [Rhodoferax sp.]